jgi:hypothetical protein
MRDLQFDEEGRLEMPIRLGFIWRLAVVALIVTANAASFSFFPPEYRVSRSFSVHVELYIQEKWLHTEDPALEL